jgi:hypothetical protein
MAAREVAATSASPSVGHSGLGTLWRRERRGWEKWLREIKYHRDVLGDRAAHVEY